MLIKYRRYYKRVLSIALSITLILTSIQLIMASADGEDISFSGFTDWYYDGQGNFGVGSGISGNGALISKINGSSSVKSEKIMVSPGELYSAGISVKAVTENTPNYSLSISFYSENSKSPIETKTLMAKDVKNEFQKLSGDFNVPENASFAELCVTVGNNKSVKTDEYIIDDAFIYAYGSATPIYESDTADGYTSGEWYRYPDGNNKRWSNTPTRYIETVENGNAGKGALHIVNTSPEGDMWLGISANTKAGKAYSLTLKVKGYVTTPGQSFRFAEADKIDSNKFNITPDQAAFDDWTEKKFDFVSSGSGKVLFVFSQYNNESNIYIDDLKITDVETGEDALNGKGGFALESGYTLITANNLVSNNGFEDVIYKYLPISEFNGNFEGAAVAENELEWKLYDNSTSDTLEVVKDGGNGNALMVTKGGNAVAHSGWTTLSTPKLNVTAGKTYRVAFDIKGEGKNPYYILTGYYFLKNGTAVEFRPGTEGKLAENYNRISADFDVIDGTEAVEIRIVFQGDAGDKAFIDNVSVNPLLTGASLENWKYDAGYSDPDKAEISDVKLYDSGCNDAGSVRLVQNYEKNTARSSVAISNLGKKWENGKTYVFEAMVKGNANIVGDSAYMELAWGLGQWKDSGSTVLKLNFKYDDWAKLTHEFTVTNAQWAPVIIGAGGYAGADFYIDNIRVFEKNDGNRVNKLENGNFLSTTADVDATENLIDDGDFENLKRLSIPSWSVNGAAEYDAESKIISLQQGASITSLRYNVSEEEIYKVTLNGNGGLLRISFDKGDDCIIKGNTGYFLVPDKASYVRITYISENENATVKQILLSLLENPENFDFELKDFASERPLNWQAYDHETANVTYSVLYSKNGGQENSGAMEVVTNSENNGAVVVYSKRIAIEPDSIYSVSFSGKYFGEKINIYPLVRTYTEKGNDTVKSSSYNWLNATYSSDNSGEWKTYEANFSTGEDTAFMEMRFQIESKGKDGHFFIDNIKLKKLGSADDTNLDFELGNNGKLPLNWTYYERRETATPGVFEEGSFGDGAAIKADGTSVDLSAAAKLTKFNDNATQLYFVSAPIKAEGNTNYLLSYNAAVTGNKKGSLQVCVRQFSDKGITNVKTDSAAWYWLSDAYSYGSFDWQDCGGSFKTDKSTEYIVIWFIVVGNEATDTYIDNVALTKTEEIQNTNLDFEYVSAGKPINWSVTSADGITKVNSDNKVYYRGNYSVRLQKEYSRINYSALTSAKSIKVSGGDEVEFVIHLASRNAVSGTFAAALECYNAAGENIQSWQGQERPLNSDGKLSAWNEYRITYTVSKNVREIKLILRVGGKKADVYFDAIDFYNYTENGNKVYIENFEKPSSNGMFGGWENETVSGTPSYSALNGAEIAGGQNDNGAVYTDTEILKTDYVYGAKIKCMTTGNAKGRFVITAYDWRDRPMREVVSQQIYDAKALTEIETSFTAVSAAYYRLRFEKTGGDGAVIIKYAEIFETAVPSKNIGWEGKWIVHPEDYDTNNTHNHNERNYYFRQELNLDSNVKSAQMQLTADDKADVYVNGELVYNETRTGDTWALPVTLDLGEYLKKGKNVIAVKLYNNVYAYGLLYDGIIKMENDTSLRFYSDEAVFVARESLGRENTPNPLWTAKDSKEFMNLNYNMSNAGWVNAAVYCDVGDGLWGIIDFDNSEYSDYKLETNNFVFPKETVYAGSSIEITADMFIGEKIAKTGTFNVSYWKRNTTNKICSGKLKVADGKTTDDWPIGKPFTARFEMQIPEFLAEGSYTIQFDNTVAIVSDYYIGNKVGYIKVAQLERSVTTTSEVKMYNGKPTYFVNGIPTAPIWYSRPERDNQFSADEMAGITDGGIDTAIAFILPRETLGEVWLSDGSLNTATIDNQMLGTLAVNPESKLMVAIDTTPPQWWLDANPNECVKLSNGSLSKESFASEKWRRETGEILKKIIDYLMKQPYANNIVGFKITGGTTYEWQWWGINGQTNYIGDFSSVGLTAYRKWLKNKYISNAELQKAWGKANVTFDNVTVPDIAARSASEYGTYLNANSSRDVIDYELFMGEMKTDSMLYFAEIAKKAVNNRLVVGTYGGYLLNCTTNEFATTTAQTSLQKVLDSDYIDYLTCPWIYSEREIGFSGDYMSAVDTVAAHGKLYIAEDDDRNHISMTEAPDSRSAVGWTRTAKQTIEQLKRNFAYAISKGCGLYFYSLGGTYFNDPQLHNAISAMMQEMTLSLGLKRDYVSDIAVFYDEQSPVYMPFTGSDIRNELLYKTLTMYQRRELYNIGASYDTYVLDDLEKGKVPEHKINIMLTTTQITDSERKAIEEKLEKNGNIIIWMFISGISNGKTTDISNLSSLTGMDMEIVPNVGDERKLMGTVEITNHSHYVTEGLSDVSFGAIEYATLSPVIAVTDKAAISLGVHTSQTGYGENLTGLAVKEMTGKDGSSWTSIYSAVPILPSSFIRNLLKHKGCHIYNDNSSDVIYADNNYVAVHSLFDGERTIKLAKSASVYDVFGRKLIESKADSFTFSMKKGGTYLFRIGKPNTLQIYLSKTIGGSISPEGLRYVSPGENVTFTFKTESGYKLSYLLIDGIKTTVSGNSYTFKNVNESHTVVAYYSPIYKTKPLNQDSDEDDKPVISAPTDNNTTAPNGGDTSSPNGGVVDDGGQYITNNKVKYITTTEINLPLLIALIAGAAVIISGLLILLIILLRRKTVVFFRDGKKLMSVAVKKKNASIDRLSRKFGTENINVLVKKRYVKKHNGDALTLLLNGKPFNTLNLVGTSDFKAEL